MAFVPSLFRSLLFSCLLFQSSHAGGAERRRLRTSSAGSMPPAATCASSSSAASGGGGRLEVFHRHGPCSPLGRQLKPNHMETLRRDQSRVHSLHGRVSGSTAGVTILDRPGASYGILDYVVTVGFGTPTRNFTVIFDTGSDVSWIQCKPCVFECYQQNETLFDPSQSLTYANVSCKSADCRSAGGDSCAGSACVYSVKYDDNDSTSGVFVRDALTLTPSSVLNDFKFGCGVMNHGLFGGAAGLMGLGRGRVSLASQASRKYGGGGFSYCLPPSADSTGYLSFGAGRRPNKVKFTPLLTRPASPSFYFLELVAMSVGGVNLTLPPTVFDSGTIIDSGTVISRLPPSVYSALREEFRRQMSGYPSAPPFSLLDTCYNVTGVVSVLVPTVALHFGGGVSLDVNPSGTLYRASDSQACLAFAGNNDTSSFSIVGSMQQLGFDVVYDLGRGLIGFGPGGCS